MADFIEASVQEAKDEIGGRKAVIGLSGGVDSSTAAVLLDRAIGADLVAVYVDTGLMRHKETEFMREIFEGKDMKFIVVEAAERFFNALKGETEPEAKRKIIGNLFIDIFEEEAETVGAEVLVQGNYIL